MRISGWSSDVCSSDLRIARRAAAQRLGEQSGLLIVADGFEVAARGFRQIGALQAHSQGRMVHSEKNLLSLYLLQTLASYRIKSEAESHEQYGCRNDGAEYAHRQENEDPVRERRRQWREHRRRKRRDR